MDNIKDRLNAILNQKVTEEENRRQQMIASNKSNYELYGKALSEYSQFKSVVDLLLAEANSSSITQLGYSLDSEFKDAGAMVQFDRYKTLLENSHAQVIPRFGIQGKIYLLRPGQKPHTSAPSLSIEFHGRPPASQVIMSDAQSNRRVVLTLETAKSLLAEEIISFVQRNLSVA